MTLIEKALEIIQKTNDGNNLSPSDLHITECAVNGFLTEEGEKYFFNLYTKVQDGIYKAPFFHGVENITIDHEWYVYWKGIQVEHFSLDCMTTVTQKKYAEDVSLTCQWLEQSGKLVNSMNYMKHCSSKEVIQFIDSKKSSY